MPESQVVSQPEGTPAAASQGQVATSPQGTPSQSGSATPQAQSAPTTDTFSNIDPKTLPPELQDIYKNLQADYTKKTQSIAEVRKKAESFDKLSQDQEISAYLRGMDRAQKASFKEQKQEAEKRLGEKISDEDMVKAFQTKDGFLDLIAKVVDDRTTKSQKEIDDLKSYRSQNEAMNIVESFANEVDKESGKPIRPDFYKLDEDGLINGFLRVNPPEGQTNEAYRARLNEGYAWAKSVTQKYYELGKSEALQVVQKKVATSTQPPTHAAKGSYEGPDPKKLSPREAMEYAKKGIRIPQVYD